jgi:cysteinyl-tRNA synthetase
MSSPASTHSNNKREKRFRLTNTVTGKREDFKTQKPGEVSFYSCGPTVYGPLHIGNARALLFADVMFRWLKHIGYKVNFVRNYTDVDDKIIVRALEEKIPANEVSKKYVAYCEEDIRLMGLQKPVKTVLVTESIPEIIKLIEKIIQRGHAYVVEGEVLFSIESFSGYGKLSGKNVEELQAGARVEVDRKKKNPMDFSLWKPQKPGEPFWSSPWGQGRPGWHIECSAMVSRWLGDTIDLHHGGQDLVFPHHENEIAQSEAASGKPFCNHWVHHAFMTMGNEKMSKSLGNILTIREFISRYGAELLKFIYIGHHFRSMVDFTEALVTRMVDELERVYLAKKWATDALSESVGPAGAAEAAWNAIDTAKVFEEMELELYADLNTQGALGYLFPLLRAINRSEMEAAGKPGLKAANTPARKRVAENFLALLEKLHTILNVFGEDADKLLSQLADVRKQMNAAAADLSSEYIQSLIEERAKVRKEKNFKRSDEIRAELDAKGIVLVDSPQGTTWKYK